MKKVFMSFMLAAGVYGLAFGQATQSQSQSQTGTTGMQQSEREEGWEKIGEKTVNLSEESGIFNWNTDREKTINANEKYSALKFKAKDATVNLTNVEVEYEDGKSQNLSINAPVMANSESKVVSLDSKDKKLDKITFNFEKDESAREDKAKVELWGLRSDAGSGMGQRSGTGIDRHSSDTSMYDHQSGQGSRTKSDRTQSDMDRSGSQSGQGSQYDHSRSTTPGSTTPGSTTPGSTTPGSTTPGSTTPGSTTPGSTTPGSTYPSTPGSTTPGSTSPDTDTR
jgi:hypothetical protein